jgi:hypothetical protein
MLTSLSVFRICIRFIRISPKSQCGAGSRVRTERGAGPDPGLSVTKFWGTSNTNISKFFLLFVVQGETTQYMPISCKKSKEKYITLCKNKRPWIRIGNSNPDPDLQFENGSGSNSHFVLYIYVYIYIFFFRFQIPIPITAHCQNLRSHEVIREKIFTFKRLFLIVT